MFISSTSIKETKGFYPSYPKRTVFFYNIFWIGFLIFSVGSAIAWTKRIDVKTCQLFQLFGLLLIVVSSLNLIRFKLESNYLKFIFSLYFIWLLSIVVRGIILPINFDFIKNFIFGGHNSVLIYFTPLIIFFPKTNITYKKLFDAIFAFGITYLIISLIFRNNLLVFGNDERSQSIVESFTSFSIPLGFLLMTHKYHSSKRLLIAVFIILVSLLFNIIRARRGLILITVNILFFAFFIYFFDSRKKTLILYLTTTIFLIGALYFSSIYHLGSNRIFGFISERGAEDTRSMVELYFYDDMKTIDWIIGRGISGEYFCPDIDENQVTNYRNLIETGYLQLILKGGVINLGLLLLIMIPAGILGIFFSNNLLSIAAGIWIFLFLFNEYPQIADSFDLSYMLVWTSVGICFSKTIRKMSNEDIKSQIAL